MPKPVQNDGNNAKVNVGGNSNANANISGSAKVSNQQSRNIFQQVNNNLGKNPNHSNRANNAEHSRTNKSGNDENNLAANKNGNRGNDKAHSKNQAQSASNRQNNLVRRIVSEILRQNDIYLDNKTVRNLVNDAHPNTDNGKLNNDQLTGEINKLADNVRSLIENLVPNDKKTADKLIEKFTDKQFPSNDNQGQKPQNQPTREAADLLRNVKDQLFALLNDSQEAGDKQIRKIASELSRQFHEQVEPSRNILTRGTDSAAKTFNQLNITERMQQAIKILLSELPKEIAGKLKNYQPEEILSGLLLARGLIEGGENTADLRNLLSFQPPILPNDVSLKNLKNIGQIVKILISGAASAKTTANLDLAVQKFLRILLANNETGGLLAAVQLAAQTRNPAGAVSRSIALVQIYELIARLAATGEKAMKNDLVGAAHKTVLQTNAKGEIASVGILKTAERDEQMLSGLKSHLAGAESALRQFLEFNPMAALDNSASAFDSFDDASRAQRDFVSIYQDDIDAWLKTGTHRFVKEIELENPIGVVAGREPETIFESGKVRIVLVRDGSIVGWHFLKSFLVG